MSDRVGVVPLYHVIVEVLTPQLYQNYQHFRRAKNHKYIIYCLPMPTSLGVSQLFFCNANIL